MIDAQAGMLPEKVLEWLPLVSGGIIQQGNDRASEVPQQLTRKPSDLLLLDVVKNEEIVEAKVVPRCTRKATHYSPKFLK